MEYLLNYFEPNTEYFQKYAIKIGIKTKKQYSFQKTIF